MSFHQNYVSKNNTGFEKTKIKYAVSLKQFRNKSSMPFHSTRPILDPQTHKTSFLIQKLEKLKA